MIIKGYKLAFKGVELFFPQLALKWAIRLWFTPPKEKRPDHENKLIEGVSQKKIPIEGGHYYPLKKSTYKTYHWGERGPLVLLVHGWGGRASQMASFAKPLNQLGYRVIAFDAVAHGESSIKQTNLIEFADIIKDITVRFGDIHAMIAHSFGGMAAGFAIKEGVTVNKLITVGSPASPNVFLEKFSSMTGFSTRLLDQIVENIETRFDFKMSEILLDSANQQEIPWMIIHDKDDFVVNQSEALVMANDQNNLILDIIPIYFFPRV